jgi:tetratricopeptide (TPR) repeat protein
MEIPSLEAREVHLTRASEALDAGEFEGAQVLAREVLAAADERHDLLLQARALGVQADRDRLLSKCRRAHDASQRAAYLFRLVGDIRGEIGALTTLAHVASNLGRNEDAVEAALLGVRLAEKIPPGLHRVTANNSLGVAYLWGRNWDRARVAFDDAIQASKACVPAASPAQPVLNQCLADLFRHFSERVGSASRTAGHFLRGLAERFEQLVDAEDQALSLAGQTTFDCLSRLGLAIVYAWLGELAKAKRLLDLAQAIIDRTRCRSWLDVFHAWGLAELAWKSGNLPIAQKASADMVEWATGAEHEQLASVGRLLSIRLAEAQGRYLQSLDELHRLRGHEQGVRAEALQSRERSVQWQLDARGQEACLWRLTVDTHSPRPTIQHGTA